VCRQQGVGYCGATKTFHLRSQEFDFWLPHPDGDNALRRLFATHLRAAVAAQGSTNALPPDSFATLTDLVRGMDGVALRAADVTLLPERRIILGRDLTEPPPATWLVRCPDGKPLIPANSIGIAYGKSVSLKSFAFVHLAAAIAAGRPALGDLPLTYEPGAYALYVGGEDAPGLKARLYRAFAPGEPQRLAFHPGPVVMTDSADVLDYIQRMKAAIGPATLAALIVLDTYNQTLGSGDDENSAITAGAYTANMRLLLQAFPRAAVATIHHPNERGSRVRGSTALHNNADWVLKFERASKELITNVSVAKMKNGRNDGKAVLEFAERSKTLALVGTAPLTPKAEPAATFLWTPPRVSVLHTIYAATQREEWLSTTSWREAARSNTNFDGVRAELTRLELLEIRKKGQRAEYRLTPAGVAFAGTHATAAAA
jgi:hypothetical protein